MEYHRRRPVKTAISLLYLSIFIMAFIFRFLSPNTVLYIYLAITSALLYIFRTSLVGFLGNYLYSIGKTEKAAKILKHAINRNTKQPTVYLNYSICLIKSGCPEEALHYLMKAKSMNKKVKTDINIRLTIGSCHLVMGNIDTAIQCLSEVAAKYKPHYAAYLSLAYAYYLKKEYENALFNIDRALNYNPSCGSAYEVRGQVYLNLGNLKDAQECFEKALQINACLSDSNYYLGTIYEAAGAAEKAGEYYRRAFNCKRTMLNTISDEEILKKLQG